MEARPVLLLGVVISSACALGCTTHVRITQRAHSIVNDEPAVGAVKPYPGLDPRSRHSGPLLALEFSSESDLGAVAERVHAHHLYFQMLACTSTEGLITGSVYAASNPPSTASHAYAVYVPLVLEDVVTRGRITG